MKFRNLRADEIECRVGMIRGGKDPFFTLLLYKDARCDMNILDEEVGSENWQRDHYECKSNLFARVGIKCGGEWIWKSDCGVESNTEKEKGEASDSFKRACVNWGIGRELYTSPAIFIRGHVKENNGKLAPDFKKIEVAAIEYEADLKKIARLEISGDGEIIFKWSSRGAQKPSAKDDKNETPSPDKPLTLDEACKFATKTGKKYNELTADQLKYIIEKSSHARCREAAQLVLDDMESAFEDLPPLDDANLPF